MSFDDVGLLWVLGAMGFVLLYHAFFGGLPDRMERKAFLGLLIVLGLWTVASVVLAITSIPKAP